MGVSAPVMVVHAADKIPPRTDGFNRRIDLERGKTPRVRITAPRETRSNAILERRFSYRSPLLHLQPGKCGA